MHIRLYTFSECPGCVQLLLPSYMFQTGRPKEGCHQILKSELFGLLLQPDDPDGLWQPKPGARLPSDPELKRMLTPDQWCVYDSTKAGLHRLWEQGIEKYDAISSIPPERMQISIEQLPEVRPPLSSPHAHSTTSS